MKEDKWNQPKGGVNSLRYGVMSVMAGLLVAGGALGFLSDKPEVGELVGEYQAILHSNWQLLLALGATIGIANILLTFKRS